MYLPSACSTTPKSHTIFFSLSYVRAPLFGHFQSSFALFFSFDLFQCHSFVLSRFFSLDRFRSLFRFCFFCLSLSTSFSLLFSRYSVLFHSLRKKCALARSISPCTHSLTLSFSPCTAVLPCTFLILWENGEKKTKSSRIAHMLTCN